MYAAPAEVRYLLIVIAANRWHLLMMSDVVPLWFEADAQYARDASTTFTKH